MKNPACQGKREKAKGRTHGLTPENRSFSLMPSPFSLVGDTFSATC
jgi:hypothetical protein